MSSVRAMALDRFGRPVGSAARRPNSRQLHRALTFSLSEGAFAATAQVLVATFAIPAILALGAAEMGVAVLAGTYALLCALSQLYASRLAARLESRRTAVFWTVVAQAAACALLAATGFLPGAITLTAAVIAYAAYGVAGSLSYSPWASWMSDLVPRGVRSRHFALRSLLLGGITGGVALSAGYTLRALYGGPRDAPWAAFATIFVIAAASRLCSSMLLRQQYEPPVKERPPLRDFGYLQFLSKVGRSNFANFTVCLALLHAGAFLTGSFFPVYFLRDLGYDYGTFALLPTCALLANMFFARFWGRVAERWGNRLVLCLCGPVLAVIPVFYLLPPRLIYFLAAYVLGGTCWAGLNLASFSYVMEAATPRRRARCYAYMMATVGLTMAVCTLGGGLLATRLPQLFSHQIQSLFLVAAVLRTLPAVAFILLIRELADKPPARAAQLLWELPVVRPTAGILRRMTAPFRRM